MNRPCTITDRQPLKFLSQINFSRVLQILTPCNTKIKHNHLKSQFSINLVFYVFRKFSLSSFVWDFCQDFIKLES